MPLLISSASSDVLDGLGPSDEVDSEFEPPSTGSMDLCCRSTSSSVASFSKVRVSIAESVSTVVEVISV